MKGWEGLLPARDARRDVRRRKGQLADSCSFILFFWGCRYMKQAKNYQIFTCALELLMYVTNYLILSNLCTFILTYERFTKQMLLRINSTFLKYLLEQDQLYLQLFKKCTCAISYRRREVQIANKKNSHIHSSLRSLSEEWTATQKRDDKRKG